MTLDIWKRLNVFNGFAESIPSYMYSELDKVGVVKVKRIALNKSQIKKYAPPPNPTKLSDSRAKKYIKAHGNSSWELDALSPSVIEELIKKEINKVRDNEKWKIMKTKLEKDRKQIEKAIKLVK